MAVVQVPGAGLALIHSLKTLECLRVIVAVHWSFQAEPPPARAPAAPCRHKACPGMLNTNFHLGKAEVDEVIVLSGS